MEKRQSIDDSEIKVIPFSTEKIVRSMKRHKTTKTPKKTFNPIAFSNLNDLNLSYNSKRESQKEDLVTPIKLCQNNIQEICQGINSNYYKIQSDSKPQKNELVFKKLKQEKNSSNRMTPTIQINQFFYSNNVNHNINININEGNNVNINVTPFDLPDKSPRKSNRGRVHKEVSLKKQQKKKNFLKFKITINSLRFFTRLKLRLVNYGSTIRRPKFIERNDLNYFYNKTSQSEAKTKEKETSVNTSFVSTSSESKVKLPWYIFHCDNKCLIVWNYLIFLLTIYIVLILPYRISFNDDVLIRGTKIFWFDMTIEIIFIIDFILHCFTAFYQDDGTLEYNLGKIFLNYLNGWMILDLLSIFPFYVFEWNSPSNKGSLFIVFRITKFYRLTRMTKFFKFTQNINCLKDIDSKNPNYSGILKILGFILSTFIICHIFACFWYFIARMDSFNPDTWIMRMGLIDDSNFSVYLKSLYFAFTVFLTVGYGDIYAVSKYEILVMNFWLVFCGIYYSFNLSSLGSVFEGANAKAIEINNATTTLKELSKRNKFPKKLEEKIKSHIIKDMRNKDYNEKGDVKLLLNELTIDLKHQIVLDIYDHKIKTIKLFSECTKEFVSNFVPLLEPKIYPVHSDIYRIKEMPENIFFILEGEVYNLTEERIPFCEVKQGSYFGDIEILRKTYRETGVTTKTSCHLLLMKKNLLYEELVRNDPIFLVKLIENMIKKYKCLTQMKKIIKSIIDIGSKYKYNKYSKDDYERQDKSRWSVMYYYTGLEILMKEDEKGNCNIDKNKQLHELFRSVSYIMTDNFESVKLENKQTNLLVNKLRLSINLNRQSTILPNAIEFNKEMKGERFSLITRKGEQYESIEKLKERLDKVSEENRELTEQLANLKKSKNKDVDEIDNDFKMNNFLRLDSLNIKNFSKKNLSKIKRISSYNNNLIANKETIKKRSNSSKNKKSHNTKISQCFDN